MNTENSMRQHQTPTRTVKLQNIDNSKRSYGGGETGYFIHCYWECRMVHLCWKTVKQFPFLG